MSQAGYTPIQLYHSTTASAAPTSGNMVVGELALNVTDKKLFASDGTDVFLLAQAGATALAANLVGGDVGYVPYQSATDETSFLAPDTAGYVLQTNGEGSPPSWAPVVGFSGGTVTSVTGTGTANGLTLSGTVTGSGNITLGGAITGLSLTTQVTGVLPFANGGTNANSRQGAINALTADSTSGYYLRGDGTDVGMSALLATDLSGNVPVEHGGTNIASYTIGDLLYASGSTTLSKLADVATGNVLLSGGIGAAPAYGKVTLSGHVSGVLPIANGGTGNTGQQGAINALAGAVTSGQYLRGNGTNVVMSAIQASDVPSAPTLVTTNFTIVEAGGKLVFKYGATTIGSLDSSGNLIVIGNVTGYGTP